MKFLFDDRESEKVGREGKKGRSYIIKRSTRRHMGGTAHKMCLPHFCLRGKPASAVSSARYVRVTRRYDCGDVIDLAADAVLSLRPRAIISLRLCHTYHHHHLACLSKHRSEIISLICSVSVSPFCVASINSLICENFWYIYIWITIWICSTDSGVNEYAYIHCDAHENTDLNKNNELMHKIIIWEIRKHKNWYSFEFFRKHTSRDNIVMCVEFSHLINIFG